ncbi:MAG: hypothetical protein J5I93_29630 [Pirellulaceae bacterium]|nr:hypothetical protein [Pirellulaceae bacterium]
MTTEKTGAIEVGSLEIVGLNGAASVECGRALPIVRRKSDGAHAVLDLSVPDAPLTWYPEGQAMDMLAKGRWTRLASPLTVPYGCRDATGRDLIVQPMMVFADETLLDMADRLPHPVSFSEERLTWRRLESRSDKVQAACASAPAVERLLDLWGDSLLQRFDAMFRAGRDRDYLRRIADFALCAARNKSLRWKTFTYYATVQDADRVRSTFDKFIQREFPSADWGEFLDATSRLREYLGRAPVVNVPPTAFSSELQVVLSKVRGIAAVERMSADELFAT